jgi:hypothetical protein
MSDNIALSHINAPGLQIRSNSSDDIEGFDTPGSRSSCFSFTHSLAKTVESCGVEQYLGNLGRGDNKDGTRILVIVLMAMPSRKQTWTD